MIPHKKTQSDRSTTFLKLVDPKWQIPPESKGKKLESFKNVLSTKLVVITTIDNFYIIFNITKGWGM